MADEYVLGFGCCAECQIRLETQKWKGRVDEDFG